MTMAISVFPTIFVLFLCSLLYQNVSGNLDIIFSNKKDIRQFTHGSSKYTNIRGGLEESLSVAYAFKENILFYTNSKEHHRITVIERASLNNIDKTQQIVDGSPDVNSYVGLSVDWVTKKLYICDQHTNRVEVVDYDGSNRRALVSKKLDQPRDVAVLPQLGYMFVTDWGSQRKVERYNMDGSNATILVHENIKMPIPVAVDVKTNLVYWGDISLETIDYMTVDGKNRTTIQLTSKQTPYFLAVFDNIMYWTNTRTSLFILHKDSPVSQIQEINELGGSPITPFGLVLYAEEAQPTDSVTSACLINNGGCSHLCLLVFGGFTCACPTGYQLKKDGKTCVTELKQFLLIGREIDIRIMSLDADQNVDLILPIKGIRGANGIDYDILKKKVFWADTKNKTITCAFLNGTGVENIVSNDIEEPDDLAIDWMSRQIYWTDTALKRIEVARLDGSARKILISKDLYAPHAIAVDPGGKIYWSDWNENISRIESADLDGSNRHILLDKSVNQIKWPNAIALDLQRRIFYWSDAKYKVINSYKLDDGKNDDVFSQSQSHPFSVTVLGDDIYWTDLYRRVMKMNTVKKVAKQILGGDILIHVRGIKAVDTNLKYDENAPCFYKNNNCSHLCFHNRKENRAKCACPAKMELLSDGKTCQVPSGFLLFSDGRDIYKTSVDSFADVQKVKHLPASEKIRHMDVCYEKEMIFWVSDADKDGSVMINRAFLNGSGYQSIITEGISAIAGLAVDWMAENIYWVLPSPGRIEVSRMDGKYRRALIYGKDIISPRIIAVDPHISKIYWFHEDSKATFVQYTLWEASLDGKNQRDLVKNQTPRGTMAVDTQTNIVYWVVETADRIERIQSYNPHDQMLQSIAITGVGNMWKIWAILVFRGNFLFSVKNRSIKSRVLTVKKMSLNTTQPTSLLNFTPVNASENDFIWIREMKVFHPMTQTGSNNCSQNNGGCEQLCFASSPSHYICNCSTHYTLNTDGLTCLAPQHFMLFSTGNSIHRVLFDNEQPDAVLPISVSQNTQAIDFDVVRGVVYLLSSNRIIRSRLDGTQYSTFQLLSDDLPAYSVHDFSIDPFSNAMYWTDSTHDRINYINLVSFANGTLVSKKTLRPRKIVVYPEIAKMFWTSLRPLDDGTNIMVSTLAGSNIQAIRKLAARSLVEALTVDFTERRLYWLDSETKRISSISIDGKDEKLYKLDDTRLMEEPIAFVVYLDYIYWMDKATKFVVRYHKIKQNNPERYYGKYEDMHAMALINFTRRHELNPCTLQNGGCSHICYIDHGLATGISKPPVKAACACPLHFELHTNKTTCIPASKCDSDEFFCKTEGKCIKNVKLCDFKCDCHETECEDEIMCNHPTDCSSSRDLVECGQFCLQIDRTCDGIDDCPDKEDEANCNPCLVDQFFCSKQKHCVPSDSVCNGYYDCVEGEDEINCNHTTIATVIVNPSPGPRKSSFIAGIVSGVIICVILLMFAILLWLKLRNSKKNAALQHENETFLTFSSLDQKAESVTSEDQAKSSVSTYISNTSHATEPSYYDRNNLTGASSTLTSEYSRVPFNPPPSPITALSTISETNDPYVYQTCDHCRNVLDESNMSELDGGGDAPPPTLASTGLLDEIDMYYPIQQQQTWQHKTVCDNCQQIRRGKPNRRSNRREKPYRSNGVHRGGQSDHDPLQEGFSYKDHNEQPYDGEAMYMDMNQQRHPYFDPPPTPCTYLSDDERPASPARTEHSIAFSNMRGGGEEILGVHYAPPPSPTSQL